MRRLLLICSLSLAAACGGGSAAARHSTPAGYQGGVPATAVAMPVATLTDQDGHRATIASGRVTLLYFGYTSCPDVCPTTMADIAAGLRKAGPGVAAKVRVVMVSSDPVRDTPAALKQWLGGYDPSFEGLTGDWATITRAARTVGVLLPETQPVALTDVGHSAQVIGYTADGAGRVMWLGSATPGQLAAQIAHDVPLLVAGRG